jgi:hypothetical protein
MSGAATSPRVLRLVNADDAPVSRPRHTPVQAEHATTGNTRARLDAADARWVLAVRTTMAMEGGRAAILRPEARRKLTSMAVKMGLRPFDAALVIAIAQDAARTGEALSGPPGERLTMVRGAAKSSENQVGPWIMLMLSCFVGALFFSIMRVWLLR